MSTSAQAQPETQGALSHENAPQVVVRAEKYFLCTACGTMVEIPAEVVGQLVLAPQQEQSDQSHKPQPPVEESTTTEPSLEEETGRHLLPRPPKSISQSTVDSDRPKRSCQTSRPPRPKRPAPPHQGKFNGTLIDGLRVPSAEELDRALNWVSFHLTVLDRQGSEIKRLQKQLKQVRKNSALGRQPPLRNEEQTTADVPQSNPTEPDGHACANESLAPKANHQHERGPP